jgi:hypothetical protein
MSSVSLVESKVAWFLARSIIWGCVRFEWMAPLGFTVSRASVLWAWSATLVVEVFRFMTCCEILKVKFYEDLLVGFEDERNNTLLREVCRLLNSNGIQNDE